MTSAANLTHCHSAAFKILSGTEEAATGSVGQGEPAQWEWEGLCDWLCKCYGQENRGVLTPGKRMINSDSLARIYK